MRTFHVYANTTRIKVEQVMRNVSKRQIRWGIWHLIQNDAADANDPSKPNPELYVFVPGTLEAVVYSLMGEELNRESLQPVDPREVVKLDRTVPLPDGAFRVSVRIVDSTGENRGWLGNAVLK